MPWKKRFSLPTHAAGLIRALEDDTGDPPATIS
jgi:hypothetical protein